MLVRFKPLSFESGNFDFLVGLRPYFGEFLGLLSFAECLMALVDLNVVLSMLLSCI